MSDVRLERLMGKVLHAHEPQIVLSTDIQGQPLSQGNNEDYMEGFQGADFAVVECTCGWKSEPFIPERVDSFEEIHELHVREELKNSVYH